MRHGEEEGPRGRLAHLVDGADVHVIESRRGARLAEETLLRRAIDP
jgi:hypothetical protein